MDFYNTQMTISNDFNPMHGIVMFAASQIFLIIMFCLSPSVSKDEYDALKKNYDILQAKNEDDIEDYNELVDKYNSLLEENTSLEEKNEKDIADYNVLVEKYNGLLDESETRISRLETRLHRNFKHKP